MTKYDRRTERLTREAAEARASLAATLQGLAGRTTDIDWLGEVAAAVQDNGAALALAARRRAAENPGAAALTGAGLALALLGSTRLFREEEPRPGAGQRMARAAADALRPEFDARVAEADRSIRRAASGRAEDLRDAVEETGASMSDAVRRKTAEGASTVEAHLRDGLESLGEEAQARVMAARRRAGEAQEAVVDQARDLGRKAEEGVRDNPILYGLGAIAAGAALAAFLPKARPEPEPSLKERLVAEAEAIYAEELERAHRRR